MSAVLSVLWLSRTAVQPIAPIGDDDHRMSEAPPILWLNTNAVQLTFPMGDDGQLMSEALSVAWLSKESTADRRYWRRRPADVRCTAHPMA